MKKIKVILLFMALLTVGLVYTSCGNDSQQTEQQSKEYTSAFVCPMHCEGSGSDKAGTCPVCNMDYVERGKHESDGHKHDGHGGNEGHDHSGHEGHNH